MTVAEKPSQKCVCFVSLEIYPTTPGGAGILIAQAAQILLSAGYQVTLLLGVGKEEFERFNLEDRFVFESPDQLKAYRVEDLASHHERPRNVLDDVYDFSIKIAQALVELRKRQKIDLIELYDYCGPGWHALGRPELYDVPIAVRLHSTIELISRRVRDVVAPSRLLHFHQERDQLRLADALFFSGPRFLREEIKTVYPFLDEARAHRSAPPLLGFEAHPPRQGANDVLFYGRLSTLKGLDTFIRGVALALADPEFSAWAGRIVIAGPAETVASGLTLEEMLAVVPDALRDRLHFVGRLTHPELQRLLPDVAFAVFANKLESFCYAAHELRVSGVPLVLTNLPTFRDFFVDDETAVFFDGSAAHLAEKIRYMAREPALRARLSERGVLSAPDYLVNHYDEHLAHAKPRRAVRSGAGVRVTGLVFSDGDRDAEARTVASLRAAGGEAVILRPDARSGWMIGGTRFHNDPDEPRARADSRAVGDAVLGLRAGDVVDAQWLTEARAALESDPLIGVVAGWRRHDDGIRSSADHLAPELALAERMGLRRLIRMPRRLMFAEVGGLLKNAGEVGLILAARASGMALIELPRVAVDVTQACETPRLDVQTAMRSEADLLDVGVLAFLPDLARAHGREAPRWREAFGRGALSQLTDAVQRGLCRITARPDVASGEVWLLRVFYKDGVRRAPWKDFDFEGEWREEKQGEMTVARVTGWTGSVSFAATDDTTIDLLQGPFCGACEIRYGDARAIFELKGPTVCDATVRLRDMAILEAPAAAAAAPAASAPSKILEQRLLQADAPNTLTICRPDGWTARRAAPLGASILAPKEVLASGALSAAAALASLRRRGQVERIAIEIASVEALDLLEQVALTGVGGVSAILPGEIDGFDGHRGYAASVVASAALAGLARRMQARGSGFAIASPDDALGPLFESVGAPFTYLPTAPLAAQWDASEGPPTLAIVGRSGMSPVRTHLFAAALILQRRLGRRLRVFAPAEDSTGDAVLREFGTPGVVRYERFESDVGVAPGPAIALAVYPDPMVAEATRDVAALGFAPLLGPAAFRWAHGGAEEDARRFRVEFWDDAQSIARLAECMLNDWTGARAAYDRLARAEANMASAARATLWGAPAARSAAEKGAR